MEYDKMPPMKFGRHVILDDRTGVTHFSTHNDPRGAVAEVVQSLGYEEYQRLSVEAKTALHETAQSGLEALILGRQMPETRLFEVLSFGNFHVTGGSLDDKNTLMLMDRFAALVGGAEVNEEDRVMLGWWENKKKMHRAMGEARPIERSMMMDHLMRELFGRR